MIFFVVTMKKGEGVVDTLFGQNIRIYLKVVIHVIEFVSTD